MSDISLNKIKYFAYKMDTSGYGNNDGKIDKQEAARIALLLKDTQGLQDVSQFFATTVLGGTDGQGLFPDADGDGKLVASDLNTLAAKTGSASGISLADLKAQFGDRASDTQSISLQSLKTLANLPPVPGAEFKEQSNTLKSELKTLVQGIGNSTAYNLVGQLLNVEPESPVAVSIGARLDQLATSNTQLAAVLPQIKNKVDQVTVLNVLGQLDVIKPTLDETAKAGVEARMTKLQTALTALKADPTKRLKDVIETEGGTPPTPGAETDGVAFNKIISFAAQIDNSMYGDKDGKISKKEAARMAMLLSDVPQNQDVAKFWATTILGGTDGAGLSPDTDGDGKVSRTELAALAGKVGSAGKLSVEDFKSQFGDRAGAGQTLSLSALYEEAHFDEVKAPQPSGITNSVNAFISKLLQALLAGTAAPADTTTT